MSLSSHSSSRENFSPELFLILKDDDNDDNEDDNQKNETTDSESENVPSNGQISNQDFRLSRNEFRSSSQDYPISSQESRDSRIGSRVSGQVRDSKDSVSGALLCSMESSRKRVLTER